MSAARWMPAPSATCCPAVARSPTPRPAPRWKAPGVQRFPRTPGRDTTGILDAVGGGGLAGLLIGGVEIADLPDPAAALAAVAAAGFVVSLELRASAVTELADVVFPVAAVAEKSGAFVNWEGRHRPFGAALAEFGTLDEGRILDTLGVEMDVDLLHPDPASPPGPTWAGSASGPAPTPAAIEAPDQPHGLGGIASTFDPLGRARSGPAVRPRRDRLDRRLRAGELADEPGRRAAAWTASRTWPARPSPRSAGCPPADAARLGLRDGDDVKVSGPSGGVGDPAAGRHRHGRRRGLAAGPGPGRPRSGALLGVGCRRPGAGRTCLRFLRRRARCLMSRLTSIAILADSSPGVSSDGSTAGAAGRRPVVADADQGRHHLRVAAAADAVRDLVRAQGGRPHAASARPELERPVRTAPVTGRRPQADVQRGHDPDPGRQVRLHRRPDHVGHPGVPDLLDHPARRRGVDVRPPDRAADDRSPVGVLAALAFSSIGVYGIVLGGWASGSTYPLLGGLRSAAQLISYEVAMGLSFVAVFLYSGTLSTSAIVNQQAGGWYIWLLPVSFIVYCVSMVGETNRAPFDMAEAEGELVGGFNTEYTSMRFGLFFLAEYINMINVSAIATTLFLGGWRAPWPISRIPWANAGWVTLIWFFIKVLLFMFVFVWLRGTLPRIRYDQFMTWAGRSWCRSRWSGSCWSPPPGC